MKNKENHIIHKRHLVIDGMKWTLKHQTQFLLYFPHNTMRILKDTDYTPRLFTVKNALQRIDAFVFLTINNIH